MFNFLKKGVLGMNARNLLYIDVYNQKEKRFFAKDKIAVKKYLGSRDIPIPRTLDIFPPKRGSYTFSDTYWEKFEKKGFVIKPNTGSTGTGITVIVDYDREKDRWIRVDGKLLTTNDLSREVVKIWMGMYSNEGKSDTVLIEDRVISHKFIDEVFNPTGLPDIRVVVRNMIPIMAMLRIPTVDSQGKANLDKGAYAIAVDIATGQCLRAYRNGEFVYKINNYDIRDFVVPFWDDVLYLASKLQKITNIGYLACDFVITDSGPIMLEINGRGGLKIQIPNKIGLESRLNLVKSIKVRDEDHAVEVVKNLFGAPEVDEKEDILDLKPIIGIEEISTIVLKNGEVDLSVRFNPDIQENFLDEDLFYEMFPDSETGLLKIKIEGKKLSIKVQPKNFDLYDYKAILGKGVVSEFLLDVTKNEKIKVSGMSGLIKTGSILKEIESISNRIVQKTNSLFENIKIRKPSKSFILTEMEFDADSKLFDIHGRISLLPNLIPVNLVEEKQKFIDANGHYDPQFRYDMTVPTSSIRKTLDAIRIPRGRFEKLFTNKKRELHCKLDLLDMIGKDAEEFTRRGLVLFGEIDPETVSESQDLLSQAVIDDVGDDFLKKVEVEQYLKKWAREFYNIEINIIWKANTPSPASLSNNKSLVIRSGSKWSLWRLRSMFEHEISVHYLRYMNALKNPLTILQVGSGFYYTTEEGLSMSWQQKFTPQTKKRYYSPYSKYLLVDDAMNNSFSYTYSKYSFKNVSISTKFSEVFRVKRGIADTKQKGAFTKDIAYLDGWKLIDSLPIGTRRKLFYGKFAYDELPILDYYIDQNILILPKDYI